MPDDFTWFADTFHVGGIVACNIGLTRADRGFQVSVRREGPTDGWEVFYGHDLKETLQRAATCGPQSPPDPGIDDWSHLV